MSNLTKSSSLDNPLIAKVLDSTNIQQESFVELYRNIILLLNYGTAKDEKITYKHTYINSVLIRLQHMHHLFSSTQKNEEHSIKTPHLCNHSAENLSLDSQIPKPQGDSLTSSTIPHLADGINYQIPLSPTFSLRSNIDISTLQENFNKLRKCINYSTASGPALPNKPRKEGLQLVGIIYNSITSNIEDPTISEASSPLSSPKHNQDTLSKLAALEGNITKKLRDIGIEITSQVIQTGEYIKSNIKSFSPQSQPCPNSNNNNNLSDIQNHGNANSLSSSSHNLRTIVIPLDSSHHSKDKLDKFYTLEPCIKIKSVKSLNNSIEVVCRGDNDKMQLMKQISDLGFDTKEKQPKTAKIFLLNVPSSIEEKHIQDKIATTLNVNKAELCLEIDSYKAHAKNDYLFHCSAILKRIFAKKLIEQKSFAIGLNRVSIRPFKSLQRCRFCQSLHHFTRDCRAQYPVCEECAGPHESPHCSAHYQQCFNCISAQQEGFMVDFNHASSSPCCPTFRRINYQYQIGKQRKHNLQHL